LAIALLALAHIAATQRNAHAQNAPPVAIAQSVTTAEGAAVQITLSGNDVDTCELTFVVASPPGNGVVGGVTDQACSPDAPNADTATVIYTPDPGFLGSDSFAFTVDDGTSTSTAATVTVAVTPMTPTCGNGSIDGSEQCDAGTANGAAGSCCSAACTFVDASTTCRPAASTCDVAESCDGVSPDCPQDGFRPDGTACSDEIACTHSDQCRHGACSGTSVYCGDGYEAPSCGEECDDGNMSGGDGCSATCREEPENTVHYVLVLLRRQIGDNSAGKIRMIGYFLTHPPADRFDASADINLRLQDTSGHDLMRTFHPSTCRTTGRRIVCKENGRFAAFHSYVGPTPSRGYRLKVMLAGLALDPPFSGPVTVTLTHGSGSNREGSLGYCDPTAFGLRCRTP
jgi:cysteine-rich repeat protein